MVSPELSEIGMVSRELSELSLSPELSLHIWSPLQVPSLELESKLAASVEPGYNSPSRVRDSDLASDGTSQTGEAAAGFVQRPAIPPRPRRVTSRSPLEITAEYETVASFLEFFRPRTGLMQGLRGLCAIGRLLIPLHVQGDTLANVFSRPH